MIALVLYLAWSTGGYFAPSYLTGGVVAFAVLGVLLILRPPHYALSTQALIALGALIALAVWTGLATRWSTAADTGLENMQRALLYVALFALALIAAGSGRLTRHIAWLVLATIVVIVGAGLISRLYPDLIATATAGQKLAAYRLGYPLSYWNAFGALAAMGGVLGLGLAADPHSRVPLRALAAGAALVLSVAMYLSLSRGAWLAMAVGLVVLVALGAHRASLLASAGIVGAGAALAIAGLSAYPALTDNPAAGAGQQAAGHAYARELALLVAACVAAQAVIAAGRASPKLMASLRELGRPLALPAIAVALVVGTVGYAIDSGPIEGHTETALHSANSWVSRQWRDFLKPATFSASGTERLTSARGSRSDLYRAAFDGFEAHPLAGDGAGSFEYRWTRTRKVDETVRNAHSLYIETLGELGLVGGGLLALFVASIVLAAIGSRMRPGGLGRSQTAAIGSACAVWLAHTAVDWDWQMPALTGVGLILAATLFPYGRRRGRRRDSVAAGGLPRSWYFDELEPRHDAVGAGARARPRGTGSPKHE